jgi:hypothetical protein
MCGACSKHKLVRKYIQNFDLKIVKGRDYSEDVAEDGMIILEWMSDKQSVKL